MLSVFRVREETPHRVETILPKGNVDLLFNLGDAMRGEAVDREGYTVPAGAAWIGGLKTRPYSVLPHGTMHLIGVSLRGETCAGLLPLSPAEIINCEAHDLPAAAGFRTMAEQLHDLASFEDQLALLTRWLLGRLRPLRGADAVRHACALLRQSRAEDAVRRTAKEIAVSPRHLRRMLSEHVGLGPAEYVRLARFVTATREIVRPERTLTQVALACGYYDQAHFCRDFRSFSDMTPQEYRAQANHPVAGHIVTE